MAIRDIIKNIENKGIKETNRIRICKKYNLVDKEKHIKTKNAYTLLSNTNRERRFDFTKAILKLGATDEAHKKLAVAMIMRDVAIENRITEEGIASLNAIINEMLETIPTGAGEDKIAEWNRELLEIETGKCRGELKLLFIKQIIPELYAEYVNSPVENKVIIMESGNSPSPSSKYLSEVIKAEGKYEVLYMGLKIRQVPTAEFYMNAMEFIKELATAKAVFMSTANDLLSHLEVRKETKVIQLWHGVGTFKHVGYSSANNKNFGRSQKSWDDYDSYRNYSAFTIAAEGQRWIFEESTHLSSEIIRPIGVSRTDLFFDDGYKEKAIKNLKTRFPQIGERKIILYAPTFRGAVNTAKAPDQLDVRAMAEGLSDKYVLLIKHHGLSKDIPPVPEDLINKFAFDLNKDNVLNIDELLIIADILITDYSSVAFEFAITERPIVFFTYDLEDYIEQRGLYFDFEKDAPGPICRDTESIIKYISNIEDAFDKDKLLEFKHIYVEACDGHSTERTIALIEE